MRPQVGFNEGSSIPGRATDLMNRVIQGHRIRDPLSNQAKTSITGLNYDALVAEIYRPEKGLQIIRPGNPNVSYRRVVSQGILSNHPIVTSIDKTHYLHVDLDEGKLWMGAK